MLHFQLVSVSRHRIFGKWRTAPGGNLRVAEDHQAIQRRAEIHPSVQSREHDVPAVAYQVHDTGGWECIQHHRHHEQGEAHLPAERPRATYLTLHIVSDTLPSSLLPGCLFLRRQRWISQAVHHQTMDLGVGVGKPSGIFPLPRHLAHVDAVADECFAHQPSSGMSPAEDGERPPPRSEIAAVHESCLALVPRGFFVASNCISPLLRARQSMYAVEHPR